MTRPARVIVDVSAVKANFEVVRRCAPGARIIAIVKADAYGHGVERIASALAHRADAFGVASLEEAIKLRRASISQRIVLLEGPFSEIELSDIAKYELETVVHTRDQAVWLSKSKHIIHAWVKIDSGMHRLGFSPADVESIVTLLERAGRVIRFMTHLASANHHNDESVDQQVREFYSVNKTHHAECSISNSGAVLGWPNLKAAWVRPGLMLYGVSPFEGSYGADHGLVPAMTVESALIAVREVEAGGSVGYGRGFVCPERMLVGVVAFGYGDGYPRNAGTGTPICVAGIKTQVIGQPSMDMLTVDLRPVSNAAIGDPVVLWGPDLPVEEIAEHADTIPYELLCRVKMRARYVERES